MNATPRTVDLVTVDHGTVTITEPEWCIGHTDHRPVHRVDLLHRGPDVALSFHGRHITDAAMVQQPFAAAPADRSPRVSVGVLGLALDVEDLYALAERIRDYADALDCLGVDLDDACRTYNEGQGGR
ncbi:DUF6907 domain-containing protein [Streptomyces flaveolus]|uniref:DUF6907 domain-containing protein n=1 Tax=Streptomyces flaveolus TaxID=67297 RepID=UPI0036FD94BE